jgi:hypothetical protein
LPEHKEIRKCSQNKRARTEKAHKLCVDPQLGLVGGIGLTFDENE